MKNPRSTVVAALTLAGFFLAAACSGGGSSGGGSEGGMKWHAPKKLSGANAAFDGRVGLDEAGNALALWYSEDHLWSSASVEPGQWGAATKVDDAVLRVSSFAFDMNAAGEAVAAWRSEEADPADHFKARLFNVEAGWDDEVRFLDSLTDDGQGVDAAIGGAGEVMTVFARYASEHVLGRTYTPEGGWSGAAERVDNLLGLVNHVTVDVDGDGDAVAVWEQSDGARARAFARYYSASQGWKDASLIVQLSADDVDVDEAYVALNENGDGLAFWVQENHTRLFSRRFTGGVWEDAPVLVGATNGRIYFPAANVTPEGDILMVWDEDANDDTKVIAKKYTAGEGWDGTLTILSEQGVGDPLDSLKLAGNADGDAIAVWVRTGVATSKIYARRWSAGGGWASSNETAHTPAAGYGASVSNVKLDGAGRVAAMLNIFDLPDYELTAVYALTFY